MVYCKKVIKDSRQFWPAFVVISWSCRGVGVPAPTDRNKPCPRKAMQERGLESHAGKPYRKATHKLCNDRQARPFNIFRKRSYTCHRNIASHRSRLFKETLFFLYRGYHCEELELRGAQALCCQKYHISVQLTLLKLVIQSPTFDL